MENSPRIVATLSALGTLCLLVAAGCGGGGSGTPGNGPETSNLGFAGFTALEIADAIYEGTTPRPAGFYAEPSRDPQFFYSTRHLKNTDIDATARLDPQAAEFEVCVSDSVEAEDLERQTRPPGSLMLAATRTAEYHEFERSDPVDATRRALVRLLRCQWIDRSAVNLRAPTQASGILNRRPVTNADLRLLAEYLFTFSIYNNADYWIMESTERSPGGDIEHRLSIAELQRGAVSGCDLLVLFNWDFSTAPSVGEVRQRETTLWTKSVRRQGSSAADCG